MGVDVLFIGPLPNAREWAYVTRSLAARTPGIVITAFRIILMTTTASSFSGRTEYKLDRQDLRRKLRTWFSARNREHPAHGRGEDRGRPVAH